MKTYEVAVASGWAQIDLLADNTATVRDVVRRLVAGVEPQRASEALSAVHQQVQGFVDAMGETGAVACYLPVLPLVSAPVRPYVVAVPLTVPEGSEPLDVLLALASSDPSAQVVDVGELVALRLSVTEPVDGDAATAAADSLAAATTPIPAAGSAAVALAAEQLVATRVRYLVGDTGDRDRWVELFFSVDHPDDPISVDAVEGLVAAFDAQVQTFRWTS